MAGVQREIPVGGTETKSGNDDSYCDIDDMTEKACLWKEATEGLDDWSSRLLRDFGGFPSCGSENKRLCFH